MPPHKISLSEKSDIVEEEGEDDNDSKSAHGQAGSPINACTYLTGEASLLVPVYVVALPSKKKKEDRDG